MIGFTQSRRTALFARPALGLALAAGLLAGNFAVATPAFAAKKAEQKAPSGPKIKMTKAFEPVSNAMVKSWQEASVRPDVVAAQAQLKANANTLEAATTRSAQKTAQAAFDASQNALKALLQPQYDQFRALVPQIGDNNDRFQAGLIGLQIGLLTMDQGLQRQALQLQVDSGFAPADKVPVFNYYIGKFAYGAKDYAGARAALQSAVRGGYLEGDIGRFLAETYFSQNDAAGGLASLRETLDLAQKAGKPVSIPSLERGLRVSSDAIIGDQAIWFASALLRAHPSADYWQSAFTAIRRAGKYDKTGNLDIARLVDRTGSYENGSDYMEMIQIGTDLALPKEVLKVADAGIKAGKLTANDIAIADPVKLAQARIKSDTDTNLLRNYERDAALPAAKVATIVGAADSFLSYEDPAKAETFYKLALTKPGVDAGLVMTRLGIAQYDQGRYADSLATFKQVTGPRQLIAQLWAIQAGLKVSPAT